MARLCVLRPCSEGQGRNQSTGPVVIERRSHPLHKQLKKGRSVFLSQFTVQKLGSSQLEGLLCHPQQGVPLASRADVSVLSQLVRRRRDKEGKTGRWTHHFHSCTELRAWLQGRLGNVLKHVKMFNKSITMEKE